MNQLVSNSLYRLKEVIDAKDCIVCIYFLNVIATMLDSQ